MILRGWWKVVTPAVVMTGTVWAALGWLPSDPTGGPAELVTQAPTQDAAGQEGAARAGRLRIVRRDASGARLLTESFYRAEAPSPSFDGQWFVFAGQREKASPPAIYRMSVDGTALHEITRGAGEPGEPIVIPGGGIVFTDRVEQTPGARALFACAVDGFALRRLTYGPHRDASPVLLDDGRVRFDRSLRGTSLEEARLTMTIRPDGTGVARFLGAAATPPAAAPSPGSADSSLVVPASTRSDPGWRELATVSAAARREPPALTSVVSPARATGTLLCLDVYASRLPALARLPRAAVARVEVTRADESEAGAVIATAPVQPDGSFLVEVPADTLLGLTLIGRDGSSLASLHSGVWVRPNENRGCVGCHEPPDRVPANRRPMAVDAPATAYDAGVGRNSP